MIKFVDTHTHLYLNHYDQDRVQVIQRAIDAGEKEAGCTVHYVVPEMDAGPIILQQATNIRYDDTADSLSDRILKIEHKLYPAAVCKLASNK